MEELWRVEYKLDKLDVEMPVTMEYGKREAFEQATRMMSYHDLIYLKLERV